jgi:hypothetical protein
MLLLAEVVVVASSCFLIGLGFLMLVKPATIERFFLSFASSSKTHLTEMFFRLLFGVSLILLSKVMWQSKVFLFFGWAVVVSSAVLVILPWQLHQRFGTRVLPLMIRFMRPYAVCVLALGLFLLYGVYHAYITPAA